MEKKSRDVKKTFNQLKQNKQNIDFFNIPTLLNYSILDKNGIHMHERFVEYSLSVRTNTKRDLKKLKERNMQLYMNFYSNNNNKKTGEKINKYTLWILHFSLLLILFCLSSFVYEYIWNISWLKSRGPARFNPRESTDVRQRDHYEVLRYFYLFVCLFFDPCTIQCEHIYYATATRLL